MVTEPVIEESPNNRSTGAAVNAFSVNNGKVTHRLWQIERSSFIGNDIKSQLIKSDLNSVERLLALTVVAKSSAYLKAFMVAYIVVIYIVVSLYDFGITNASVQIWREFNSDVVTCAPYLTEIEEEVLKSD
jgi:hypothetical protein